MDGTFHCFGFTTAFHIQRQGEGSHLVRIPDQAVATKTLQAVPPTSSLAQAQALLQKYRGPFWERDPGYRFVEGQLGKLLTGERKTIFDIGCNVGQFVSFAKTSGLWPRLNYRGVDADQAAIQVANEAHPDTEFACADVLTPLRPQYGTASIVYTKGTLCSVPQPALGLAHALACATDYALLVHTACTEDFCGEQGYATTLYTTRKSAYLFTIMNVDSMLNWIEKAGFVVRHHARRSYCKNVLNLGSYRLHDLVLERVRGATRAEGDA